MLTKRKSQGRGVNECSAKFCTSLFGYRLKILPLWPLNRSIRNITATEQPSGNNLVWTSAAEPLWSGQADVSSCFCQCWVEMWQQPFPWPLTSAHCSSAKAIPCSDDKNGSWSDSAANQPQPKSPTWKEENPSHKILISSIKTHWCHTDGIWKQNLKSSDESKAFDSAEITKLNHFTGFQCVPATQDCSLPDSSYFLPFSRSFFTTRAWGKNSLGLRKPLMSILCLSRPRPYSNRMLGKSSISWESGKDSLGQTCTNIMYS